MNIITDALGQWEQLGTLTVTNEWQLFPTPTLSETFRITTTVSNQLDWDEKKIRSGGYIRFYYAEGSISPNFYVPVSLDGTVIKEFPIPKEFKDSGSIIRSVGCVFSHKRKNIYSLASFAVWSMKLEALI